MWIERKRSVLFFWICCLLAILQPRLSNTLERPALSSALDVATVETERKFGDAWTAHFLETFYDFQDAPVVHVFLVTKADVSIPEDLEFAIEEGTDLREHGEALIESGQTEVGARLLATSEAMLHGTDQFGTLLISAHEMEPSLVAFHHGLPTYLVAKRDAEERAETFADGAEVTFLGVLYFTPLEYYYEFDVQGESILVSPFHSRIISRAEMAKSHETTDEHVTGAMFRETEAPATGEFPDTRIIRGVPDYNQRSSRPNSCGPTAGACLLGYWDGQGYDDFLEGTGTYDDVTCLIEELCDTMSWDPMTGVYYAHIPIGLRNVIDARGYPCDVSSLYSIDSFDVVKQEIVDGRPFVYGSQENPWGCAHYVVTVGYQGDFVIVHDNWWSTPVDYFVHWDALRHGDDMMTTLVPEGQVGPSSQPLPTNIGGSGGGCFIRAATPG
jgi:hypothetical protein